MNADRCTDTQIHAYTDRYRQIYKYSLTEGYKQIYTDTGFCPQMQKDTQVQEDTQIKTDTQI